MNEPKKITRRQLQAVETKKRLFDAALSLLLESDFEKITVRDIVNRAQMSVGTFYVYFPSKMDVYYETYAEADAYFLDQVAPVLCEPLAVDRMLHFFDAYARFVLKTPGLRLSKLLYNPYNKMFVRQNSNMSDVLRVVIEYGMSKGEFINSMTVEEAADFCLISARGLVYNWCTRDGDFDLVEAMRTYTKRLLRGLLA